ncbi:hypothetical protein TNCV_4464131 [Trichonephila clavipes]|nr:hypothetical protein TNCV_4464131 [Trichonephila clavipes]
MVLSGNLKVDFSKDNSKPLIDFLKRKFNLIISNDPNEARGRQPIGVTVHYTQQQIREQSLSSQLSQKLFQTQHLDEALKPRFPDPIDHPIAVMPPSRM